MPIPILLTSTNVLPTPPIYRKLSAFLMPKEQKTLENIIRGTYLSSQLRVVALASIKRYAAWLCNDGST
ncbi:891_t:CDS:2 [Funneliformis caledonium]|uniref:891_t:CDS:1 n=1 Tax=Funneliformis caledonium TaxID=1117310 RepID=A0A9N9F6S8_9GLOM|nr:891_t:CDS:2 [Funneliformis caledonium]